MKRSLIIGAMLVACLLMASFAVGAKRVNYSVADDQAVSTEHLVYRSTSPVMASALMVPDPPLVKDTVEAQPDIEEKKVIMYYTEEEVVMVAKVLYRECRGVPSITEKACVAWTICNRVDSDEFVGDTIAEIVTYPNAFAYIENTPVWDELYELALDVLSRWNAEKNGELSVGRVLPSDFEYFSGDGEHNHFRNEYTGDYEVWDYSLESPYES